MSRTCKECGMTTSPSRRVCKSCAVQDRHGSPSDHFESGGDGVRCWVQDIDETFHASMYFEDSRHVAACGAILETPVAAVKGDPRFFDRELTCEDCEQALEDDEAEVSIPDGGEFEPANRLATDGGEVDVCQWVLDTVHEYPAKPDSLWGCRGNLVHQRRKLDGVTKDDVQEAIARAIDNEDLISWHGLLARAEIETLREIVRIEHEVHDVTRQILVGKCNKLIAKKKQDQAGDSVDREIATDGGVDQSVADTEQCCFSGAFYAESFERMKESPYVTIEDYAAMGSMPEYDYWVSFRVNLSANTGGEQR